METEPERIRKILRDAFDAALLERDTASEAFDKILRTISGRLPHPDDAWRIKSASSALSVAREKMSVAMIRLHWFRAEAELRNRLAAAARRASHLVDPPHEIRRSA